MTRGFSGTTYERESSEVINLCNELRGIGVDTDINLPTIVLAGNQSSGKSSLVEGIAGFPLPKSAGTCTRCPTELRMRRGTLAGSGRIICTVKLQREFDKTGTALTPKPAEEEVTTTHEPDQIARCITAAQRILLNPEKYPPDTSAKVHASRLLENSDDLIPAAREHELDFTKNTVVLEIEGAEVDLTIVDLPGIVQSHNSEKYVDMVKQLVEKRLTAEYAIIVMVITARDDIENQAVFTMASKADPDGLRTIGVITKPDSISPGEHDRWLSLASNTAKPLKLGYYVVKNPDEVQLAKGVRGEEARKAEEEFLQDNPHWSTLKGPVRDRLGTARLRTGLSQLLVQRIAQQLPDMVMKASDKLRSVEEELRGMPPALSSDLNFEFYSLLGTLERKIRPEVTGQSHSGSKSFHYAVQRIYLQYKKELWDSMPAFTLTNSPAGVNKRQKTEHGMEPPGGRATHMSVDGHEAQTPQAAQSGSVSGMGQPAASSQPANDNPWSTVASRAPSLSAAGDTPAGFAAATAPVFGASTTTFGAASAPTLGATAAPSSGGTATPSFGATAAPSVGATATPTSAPTAAPASTAPLFGGSTTAAFGGSITAGLGSTTSSLFGPTAAPASAASSGASMTSGSTPFGSFAFGAGPTAGLGQAAAAKSVSTTAPASGAAATHAAAVPGPFFFPFGGSITAGLGSTSAAGSGLTPALGSGSTATPASRPFSGSSGAGATVAAFGSPVAAAPGAATAPGWSATAATASGPSSTSFGAGAAAGLPTLSIPGFGPTTAQAAPAATHHGGSMNRSTSSPAAASGSQPPQAAGGDKEPAPGEGEPPGPITFVSEGADEFGMEAPAALEAMSLSAVRALREEHRGDELIMLVPTSAYHALIAKFKGRWHKITMDCLDAVAKQLRELASSQLAAVFGRFTRGHPLISNAALVWLEKCEQRTRERLQELMDIESCDTFTMNDHYLEDSYEKLLAMLKKRLHRQSGEGQQLDHIIKVLRENQITSIARKVPLEQLHGLIPTEYDVEVKMMATTLAYYKVVFKRVVDSVPLSIRKLLLQDFCTDLPEKIKDASNVDLAALAALLAEDPHVHQQRLQLQDKRKRLQEAVKILGDPRRLLYLPNTAVA